MGGIPCYGNNPGAGTRDRRPSIVEQYESYLYTLYSVNSSPNGPHGKQSRRIYSANAVDEIKTRGRQ
jgi:hypothetical protein